MSPKLSEIGEFGLIRRIADGCKKVPEGIEGIGDDCAVIPMNDDFDMLVAVDSIQEGIDFDFRWSSPPDVGRKALSINLSDIAAMGGIPKYFLVSIALPSDLDLNFVNEIYSGIDSLASEEGLLMIGGDTSSSKNGVSISVTIMGEVKKGKAILRKGACAGDSIFISGPVGLSALGLAALKMNLSEGMKRFVGRHLSPIHRTSLGRALLESGCVTSMIDVSDGLFADLEHIADSSGVGFEIDINRIPVCEGFAEAAAVVGMDWRGLVLSGGEDFELVFTVDSGKVAQFLPLAERLGVTEIGHILKDREVRSVIHAQDLMVRGIGSGYDHFSSAKARMKEPG